MTAVVHHRPSGIITPEAVVLEFETAGVASRVLARLIDGVVLWFGLFAVALFLSTVFAGAGSETLGIIILVFLGFFLVFGYWMALETLWRGRTLGKAAMGLRVVTIEGAPIRFRHAAIRAMVGLVDFLLPPLGPVAVLSVLISRRDQRLGDLAAGTIVLRERSAGERAVSLALTEPPGRAELLAQLQLSPLPDGQYNVVRRFLLRAHSLTPDARAQLATSIAGAVETATGVRRPVDLHPEWYLHAAGLAHQRRGGTPEAGRWEQSQPPPPAGPPTSAGAPTPPPPMRPPAAGPPPPMRPPAAGPPPPITPPAAGPPPRPPDGRR